MSNLKKVILWVLILGVVVGAFFTYYVYQTIFATNTAFNNNQAHIYIESTADFDDVKEDLRPLLKDLESFEVVAQKKSYIGNIKAGHYVITKGMNNNDIVIFNVMWCSYYSVFSLLFFHFLIPKRQVHLEGIGLQCFRCITNILLIWIRFLCQRVKKQRYYSGGGIQIFKIKATSSSIYLTLH